MSPSQLTRPPKLLHLCKPPGRCSEHMDRRSTCEGPLIFGELAGSGGTRAGHQGVEVAEADGHEAESMLVLQALHEDAGRMLAAHVHCQKAAPSELLVSLLSQQMMLRMVRQARVHHSGSSLRLPRSPQPYRFSESTCTTRLTSTREVTCVQVNSCKRNVSLRGIPKLILRLAAVR